VNRIDENGRRAEGSEPGPLRVLLLGAGSLGKAFLRRLAQLETQSPARLVGIVTGHHGRRIAPDGIEPADALTALESDALGSDGPSDLRKIIEATRPEVMVECVPQNIRSGEPSLTFLRTALDAGVHAVTANKSAIALGYRDLRHRAAKNGVTFRFEPTVLDGMPLFLFFSRLGPIQVKRVRAVLNGTSSLVLESVQNGSTRSRGLARAQAQGIAEADAVLDVDGWDAAAKAALIANVWMGGTLRIVDVVREGCDAVKDDELRRAADTVHYRLLADIIRNADGSVRASVKPTALEPGDPLFASRGSAGGISVECQQGPSLTLLQGTHGLEDAAEGLVLDLNAIRSGAPQA
jgi:homoserine dehydrogenase